MVLTFRFEYYENVVNKHHLNKIDWKQAARASFTHNLAKTTVADVRMIDEHTVQIIKRRDVKPSWGYKLGFDQYGLFERVTINRKENTVEVDRIDGSFWQDKPFLGQRDLFYIERADKEAILDGTAKQTRLAFVRHNFWLHKVYKLNTNLMSNWSAWTYKRAFKAEQI